MNLESNAAHFSIPLLSQCADGSDWKGLHGYLFTSTAIYFEDIDGGFWGLIPFLNLGRGKVDWIRFCLNESGLDEQLLSLLIEVQAEVLFPDRKIVLALKGGLRPLPHRMQQKHRDLMQAFSHCSHSTVDLISHEIASRFASSPLQIFEQAI